MLVPLWLWFLLFKLGWHICMNPIRDLVHSTEVRPLVRPKSSQECNICSNLWIYIQNDATGVVSYEGWNNNEFECLVSTYSQYTLTDRHVLDLDVTSQYQKEFGLPSVHIEKLGLQCSMVPSTIPERHGYLRTAQAISWYTYSASVSFRVSLI